MDLKEIKKVLDASLEELSKDLSSGVDEKIKAVTDQIVELKTQMSAKEVADANKMTGISREAKTVFGAYAKTITGGRVSDEMAEKVADFRDHLEKDVILGTDASGQDLLHTQLHKGILALAETYGVFVRDAKALTATEAVYKMVFENDPGDNGDWITEGTAISQDKVTFGARQVTMKTWRKMIGVSEQMLRNSAPADLGEYLVATLAKKFGLFIEQKGFDAVIASTGVVSVDLVDATYHATNGLKSLSFQDMNKTQTACPTAYRKRAKWYMHPTVLGLAKEIEDNAGTFIFAVGPNNFAIGELLGDGSTSVGSILHSAVEITDAMPAIADFTATGKVPFIYGDLAEAFAVITRQNFRVESNNGGKYFEQGIVAVRGTADANVSEVLPGALVKAKVVTAE
jgi:HK97 family phage major capsid protein